MTRCAADGDLLSVRFAESLEQLGSPLNGRFALAASGGGDSIAMMHLAADWLRAHGRALGDGVVLTIDHGLRSGSDREAAAVCGWARDVGFAAQVLQWRGSKPRSNIEDSARKARFRLLGDWCRQKRVGVLLLAHTRDDQAETFLLRLGRGSGVDGLSAMRSRADFPLPGYDGIEVVRPLLDIERNELRGYLKTRGAAWLDDPMNEDTRFSRVRIRQALRVLETAGISSSRIAQAARHLARAREALDAETEAFLARHASFAPDGSALLDGAAFRSLQREIGLRALSAVLMRVSGQGYRPRFDRLERLYEALLGSSTAHTLLGCRIGAASKASRRFGTATLEIKRERPRKTGKKSGLEPLGPPMTTKMPKKASIMTGLSGS